MKENFDLPEYQPNKNFWDKLESERSLEKQLSRELRHLPLTAPKQEAWQGIEEVLDNHRSVLYYWKGAAAIFIAMVIAYLLFMAVETDSSFHEQEYLLTNTYSKIEIPWEVPEISEQEIAEARPVQKKVVQEIPNESFIPKDNIALDEIEVPELSMPVFIMGESVNAPKELAHAPVEKRDEKSFHEVTVSWGINDKIKINTAYSAKNKLMDTESELSKAKRSPGKFVLRFSNGQ
ncbi:hypothetical protein [Echinicola shivajiensis]|uniref:hypothetical protein n=1 Tax=Echinicola shivajiensis TaxID=1035916 RepID=UPI001BFCA518|nr:hypothetical protein [Echinicola shivajiensis]